MHLSRGFGLAAFVGVMACLASAPRAVGVGGACCQPNGICSAVSDLSACASQEMGIPDGVCFPNSCPQPNPANDRCSSARVLPGGMTGAYYVTTIGATSDLGSSSCAASSDDSIDVWFKFTNTRAADVLYIFSTSGTPDIGGNGGDTSIELFDACPPFGESLACDDDGGAGRTSQVLYHMVSGDTIYIRVAFVSHCVPSCNHAGTAAGMFVLNILDQLGQPPANDRCANAMAIPGSPSSVLGTNDLATGVDISPCANADEQDVWYAFTPASDGQYVFDTLGSTGNTDTSLAVFDGCPNDAFPLVQPNWQTNLLACNDDIDTEGGEYLSMVRVNLVAGRAYKVRVSGFGNTTGDFQLNTSGPTALLPPIPDTCATAQVVTGTFTAYLYTGGARPDAPSGSCNSMDAVQDGVLDNAIWFTFTPAAAGTLSGTIDGVGGAIKGDSELLLLTGPCGGPLAQVACIDEPEPFDLGTLPPVAAGTTYHLVVGDVGRFDGGADLAVSITVPGNAAMGACCAGATCSQTTAAACTGVNRSFSGAGMVCNAFGMNNTTPCCFADFNKNPGTLISVQDIFDFLAAYFVNDPLANINGSAAAGQPTVTVQDIFDFLAGYFGGGC